MDEEPEEREVFRFFDPEEWDSPGGQQEPGTEAAETGAFARQAAEEPSADRSLEELLTDVDGEINGEKYINILDDDEVPQEEIDAMVREELVKRGLQTERPLSFASGDGAEAGDGSALYADDLVSNNDPLIAQLEEEAKKLAEADAEEPITRRERRALAAARREAEQARQEAERAAAREAARRGAVGQIEAERRRISERIEAEAATRKAEEKRLARRKAARRRRAKGGGALAAFRRVITVVLVAAVVFVLLLLTMGILGRSELRNTKAAEAEPWIPEGLDAAFTEDGSVLYKDAVYRRDAARSNILLIALDGASGDADSMLLLSLDTKSGESVALGLPGDTLADVDFYASDGSYTGTRRARIAEAYRGGGRGRAGCENAAMAVSRLLFGLPVNACFAVDLAAAGPLADAVGGVPSADIAADPAAASAAAPAAPAAASAPAPAAAPAPALLTGAAAEQSLRSGTFATAGEYAAAEDAGTRTGRQLSFIAGFLRQAAASTKENPLFPLYLYNYLRHYSWSDLTLTRMTYLSLLYLQKGFRPAKVITLPGRAVRSENVFRYEVKQKTLYRRLLGSLYRH